MLTPFEKFIFVFAVIATIYNGYLGFRKVFLVIRRGQGDVGDDQIVRRAVTAALNWLFLRPTWKVRKVSSLFHAFIAWGFIFYFLVNFGDVVEGYFPVTFLGTGWIGNLYRLVADVLSVGVLVGMVYFLVRRFVFRAPALQYRENVMLVDRVKAGGIRRDSLIVGLFILFHVGFRFLGQSFKLAQHGADPFQPFATAVSALWLGWSETALVVAEHVAWWGALGLILAFIPYFPYSKHIHLIMSGVNFLVRPQRTALGALEPIDFADESIEQFGVAKLEHLPWKHLL
ncbi:MAG: [Fe-S]-binding protein, partial [Anaerolineae bacterium]|nr:[Fe-S]-binding protein [Anaerolineae bacterium]